jgi:hypothetical protein
MLRRVTLVRTYVSEELSACFIRVTAIGELGTTLAVTSNRHRLLVTASVVPSSPILVSLMMEAPSSSEISVLTRSTRRNIPEDGVLHSHCRENLTSYISLLIYGNDDIPCFRYVEDVESVFSTLLFIYFSLNGALMCLTVFQSTVVSTDFHKYWKVTVEI